MNLKFCLTTYFAMIKKITEMIKKSGRSCKGFIASDHCRSVSNHSESTVFCIEITKPAYVKKCLFSLSYASLLRK